MARAIRYNSVPKHNLGLQIPMMADPTLPKTVIVSRNASVPPLTLPYGSMTSVWAASASARMAELVTLLDAAFPGKIAGVHLAALAAGENRFECPPEDGGYADYSLAMQAEFCTWRLSASARPGAIAPAAWPPVPSPPAALPAKGCGTPLTLCCAISLVFLATALYASSHARRAMCSTECPCLSGADCRLQRRSAPMNVSRCPLFRLRFCRPPAQSSQLTARSVPHMSHHPYPIHTPCHGACAQWTSPGAPCQPRPRAAPRRTAASLLAAARRSTSDATLSIHDSSMHDSAVHDSSILDHCSRLSQRCTPCAPCDMPYLVPMLVGGRALIVI